MWFIGVEVELIQRRVHLVLKKILDPPLQIVFVLIQVCDNCEIRKHSTVCRCGTDAI